MTDSLIARIEHRLKALGWSERKACLKAGLGVDTIRDIRRRGGGAPGGDKLAKLAAALDCSIDWLLTGTGNHGTNRQAEALNRGAAIDPDHPDTRRIHELTALRGLAEDNASFEGPGEGGDALLATLYPNRTHAVWMRCSTDAMTRFGIMPGDFLIVDPELAPQPGQAVVAQCVDNQRGTAKTLLRAFYAGILEPHSHNPANKAQILGDTDATTTTVFGVIVRVYRATI